jgi:uncharacterized membrane protein
MLTDVLLFLHFFGLMMGAGGGFGSAIVMRTAATRPPAEAGALHSVGPTLARFAATGVVVMLASGLGLVFLKYGGFAGLPWLFWVKMGFVATLLLATGMIEATYAAIKRGDTKAAARLPVLGPLAGMSSFLATLFAVFAFH